MQMLNLILIVLYTARGTLAKSITAHKWPGFMGYAIYVHGHRGTAE